MQPTSLIALAATALAFALPTAIAARGPTPLVNAEDLGLRLPTNQPALPGNGRRVLVAGEQADPSTEPTVANVYLEVGNRFVVTLPNGALRSVPQAEATETDRPFVAETMESLAADLARQFPGFRQRTTRHYLFVYNTSEPFYNATRSILETMYPHLVAYCRRHNLSTQDIEMPLVVVMFKTQEQFQKYRQMPDSVLAYYNVVSNRILMYEQSAFARVAPTIAVKQSISTIAHEGVHQILHNLGVQKRLANWPPWISEGLSEYFAPTSVARRVKWKGVGHPNDLRIRELIQHAQDLGAELGTGKLIEATITAERLSSTGYAAAWALTHFLATARRQDFLAYLSDVSKILPLAEPQDELARFTRHFGGDFAKLESELILHVRGLPYVDPVANQPHYIVVARTPRRKLAVMTTSPLSVKAARGQMLAKLPAAERAGARFSIQTFPNKTAAEQAMQAFSRSR